MSMLIHNQDEHYVLMPYRERVQADSTRDLKRKVRALSRQFGLFVSIKKEREGSYLLACSDSPGILIAELIASTRSTTSAFVYVEPYDHEHCLVVVMDGLEVLMDRLIRREELLDRIMPYIKHVEADLDARLICIKGVNWSDKEKQILNKLTISFDDLDSSLWRERENTPSHLRLTALNAFLGRMHTPFYRKAWFLPGVAFLAIVGLAGGIHHVQSKHAPVFVHKKQRDIIKEMQAQAKASEVLDRISDTVIRLQGWSGVSVIKLHWADSKLIVFVALHDRLRHRSWRSWLASHDFSSKETDRQAVLEKSLLLPTSTNDNHLTSARKTFNALSDVTELALGEANLIETSKERYGAYSLIHVKLRVKGMSAARLSLLADSMRKQSIVLHKVTLHNREHRFSGSLQLTVWGYAS